jgi:hypothetical protein
VCIISENGEKFEDNQADIHEDDHTDWSSTSGMDISAPQVEKPIFEN